MKLSQAMMLGDSLRTRSWLEFIGENSDGSKCGCAIGGAYIAMGETKVDIYTCKLFPWLIEPSTISSQITWRGVIGCGSWDDIPSFRSVMMGQYTFEQLVDYVASVEPSCGDCNRFDCACEVSVSTETVAEEEIVGEWRVGA
jgi:hypothetical protein